MLILFWKLVSFMKKHLKGFIHGILIGFAFISAMGGGTLAVILGIYDDLVAAISNLRKDFKNSISYLLPIFIGGVIGILILAYPIKLFLDWQPLIATSLFVGLTLGGLIVFKNLTKGYKSNSNVLFVFFGLIIVVAIGVFSWFSPNTGLNTSIDFSAKELVILFLVGFFASSALIAPGISGTMFLISVGYYGKIVELIKTVLSFSGSSWWSNVGLLASFTVAFIIGFFAITKLMDILLKHFRTQTYFTIFGLIIGQIIISYINGEMRVAYQSLQNIPLQIVLSIFTLLVGVISSLFLLKLANKKEIVKEIDGE